MRSSNDQMTAVCHISFYVGLMLVLVPTRESKKKLKLRSFKDQTNV